MPDPLPSSMEEFHALLPVLDADVSRSQTILRHMPLPIRPETLADHTRRLEHLEATTRFLDLPVDPTDWSNLR